MLFQKLISSSCICANCFTLLTKIQKFSDRCHKAQQFFHYISSLQHSVEDFIELRKRYGLDSDEKAADRSTEAVDLQMDIKDEFIDPQGLFPKSTLNSMLFC